MQTTNRPQKIRQTPPFGTTPPHPATLFTSHFHRDLTTTTDLHTLSLHDALPISSLMSPGTKSSCDARIRGELAHHREIDSPREPRDPRRTSRASLSQTERSEEHTPEPQSPSQPSCRLLTVHKKSAKHRHSARRHHTPQLSSLHTFIEISPPPPTSTLFPYTTLFRSPP